MIYRVEEYALEADGEVCLITAKTPIDGSPVEYVGQAQGLAKGPAGQTMPIPFAFPIEGETIEQAFENYEYEKKAAWPEAIKQFRETMQKQAHRIQIAGNADAMINKMGGGNGQGMKIARR